MGCLRNLYFFLKFSHTNIVNSTESELLVCFRHELALVVQ
jgi:hypothetical protein